jgi:hypothetical protein
MKKINKIVILGGGTSGYMTASLLLKTFPNLDLTLIEDEDSGTIGVGESTTDIFNNFLKYLGLEEKEWMPYSNATYKLSIDFTNFDGKNSRIKFPFGSISKNFKYNTELYSLKKNILPKSKNSDYNKVVYSWSEMLYSENKIQDKYKDFNLKNDKAYQIEAHKFSKYLKEKYCIPRGLNHINDKIIDWELKENGELKSLKTMKKIIIESDLFIDCSGFSSFLLEKIMKEEFVEFPNLINDKAVATRMNYSDIEIEMETSTNATTLSSGWVWNIPLWNRIGTGYVYSSKFLSSEEAEAEFKSFLINGRHFKKTEDFVNKLKFKHINIKVGKHKRAMVKNVVAIGLSYGFIEPLESTGLMLTYEQINMLLNLLTKPGRELTYSSIDRTILNKSFDEKIEEWKTLIEYHYAFAEREDSPYWKYVTEEIEYNLEYNIYNLYKWENPFLTPYILRDMQFEKSTREVILSGFKGNIISNYMYNNMILNYENENEVRNTLQYFENIIKENKSSFIEETKNNQFLTHYQYLKNNIYS